VKPFFAEALEKASRLDPVMMERENARRTNYAWWWNRRCPHGYVMSDMEGAAKVYYWSAGVRTGVEEGPAQALVLEQLAAGRLLSADPDMWYPGEDGSPQWAYWRLVR